MKQLSEDQIQEIAESFDMGLTCFWNKVTGELVFVPKQIHQYEIDMELFEEDMQKIENDYENFIEITPPSSSEQFQIMADFAEQLDENHLLRDQLISALNRHKPFQGFKHIIHNSGTYRDQWFAFQNEQLQKFVRDSFKYLPK
jgi:Uncharacterised protein family (UPF0158)